MLGKHYGIFFYVIQNRKSDIRLSGILNTGRQAFYFDKTISGEEIVDIFSEVLWCYRGLR